VNPRPSQPASAESASRLAAAVAGLGAPDWHAELVALGAVPSTAHPQVGPTYEELATAGTTIVAALVEEGRWDDAGRQADRLTDLFRLNRHHLHPVAAESFDGLRAAVRARDRDEVGDFLELLGELFGDGDG
jgi:hypothetical protein